MGCPKSFSLSGGMGAALLSKPELIQDVRKSTLVARILAPPSHCRFCNPPFFDFSLSNADFNNLKEEFAYACDMQDSAVKIIS